MSAPTPAPRTRAAGQSKKPIPAPRTMIPTKQDDTESDADGKSTFSRRVRTFSQTSKQLVGDKVQASKKAAKDTIQSTRASVRKMKNRFTNSFVEPDQEVPEQKLDDSDSSSDIDCFSQISFNSPLHFKAPENIYNNIDEEGPPPPYPPPPLREEVYDKPQSLASGSTNSSEGANLRQCQNYESVFPQYPYNSDSDSCTDLTPRTIDRKLDLSRSDSWNFYDSTAKQEEPKYNNVDSTPVLPPTMDDARSYSRSNSLYENHTLPMPNRVTRSVLMEFDPLNAAQKSPDNVAYSNELSELELVLQGDLYGNISMGDNLSTMDDSSDEGNYVSPPPPPTRSDSLLETPIEPKATRAPPPPPTTAAASVPPSSNSQWYGSEPDPLAASKPERLAWLKKSMHIVRKAPEFVRSSKQKDTVVQRPMLMPKGVMQQKGMLYKITNGPVEDLFGEYSSRWCVLQGTEFICYSDSNCESVKELITTETIISIQILQDQKYKYRCENDELFCFEVNIAGKSRGGHVYGSKSSSERRVWMQKLAESLTCKFTPQITTTYTRIGWAYMKEGLSGDWVGTWLVLRNRELQHATDNEPLKKRDLRKARCFILEPVKEVGTYPLTTDKGPNMVIHFTDETLYFRMWTQRETKIWCHIAKLEAHNNGAKLDEQQLTKNDVPVLVEKCINFVYVHGSMTEGIYRKAGTSNTVSDLLVQFRNDAWAVQLTDKYTNHDVATALKRFFRDLSEPLIDISQQKYLYQVSLVKSKEERIRMYKSIFDEMQRDPSKIVFYNTTKLLLSHLYFISTQYTKNLMSTENLSAVWGPTLLQHESKEDCEADHKILAQLITLCRDIFPEDTRQAEQETRMLSILKKYASSPQGAINVKNGGDFRVWIYKFSKTGKTFNIEVGPKKTAYDVLCELSKDVGIPVNNLVIEESVLDENLIRPIHHTEKLLDVVLKWSSWDDVDKKNNALILSKLSKYNEYITTKPLPLSAELKYADSTMRQMKPLMVEFSQAKLICYKDKSCAQKINSWNIEDITWYLGHDPKRSVPTKNTVTFMKKTSKMNRTKASPYIGHALSWMNPALRAIWISAMLIAEHPSDLTPPALHVNLMAA